jgi:hypothetical protein
VEAYYYKLPRGDEPLPHDRFLITDQIAIAIGRGMDFLDFKTKKNRDGTFGLKNSIQAEGIRHHYGAGRFIGFMV